MKLSLTQEIQEKWQRYFPEQPLPVAVFYSDELHGADYAPKPPMNSRGYTCFFAQLAKLHQGHCMAFDKDNLGCWGAVGSFFGGPYQEDVTVKLLVEIEKFKIDREQVNTLHRINPQAAPTGRYIIFKPLDKLDEDDNPEIFCIFAKPDVIAALHTLASFDNTRIDNVIVPFGSGCEQAFKFTFAEGKKNDPRAVIGGMDVAMRGCVKPDQMTFSATASFFYNMVANMDRSFLITYIWQGLSRRLAKE